jgi:hypothetical protein
LLLRVGAEEPLTLVVAAGEREVGRVEISPGSWSEKSLPWPSWASGASTTVTVSVARPEGDAGGEAPRFTSFHYWLYAP